MGDRILVFGGTEISGSILNTVSEHRKDGIYSQLPEMKRKVSHATCAVWGDIVAIVGGIGTKGTTSRVILYHSLSGKSKKYQICSQKDRDVQL